MIQYNYALNNDMLEICGDPDAISLGSQLIILNDYEELFYTYPTLISLKYFNRLSYSMILTNRLLVHLNRNS